MPKKYIPRWKRNRRITLGWPEARSRIFDRDDYACRYCGDPATCVDHILPVVAGGTNDNLNLAASCFRCNARAGGNVFLSFAHKRAWLRGESVDAKASVVVGDIYNGLNGHVCIHCQRLFSERYNGATVFMCAFCVAAELQDPDSLEFSIDDVNADSLTHEIPESGP